jgi:hypothetical protein
MIVRSDGERLLTLRKTLEVKSITLSPGNQFVVFEEK